MKCSGHCSEDEDMRCAGFPGVRAELSRLSPSTAGGAVTKGFSEREKG